ncbi:hypothetical protein [Nonomuraea aridisoli]|uniref:Uncharacterized protein n=1 Tax=Nonomuraea aridisoli TaxID=2070368 RepID=A0A2W2E7W2_9ACTN|nr:hypothetical protein [Nonomuraea aridisoli]PZG20406.1 hypothetical protein C1J01_09290 [Nonomuraea aridisoli]
MPPAGPGDLRGPGYGSGLDLYQVAAGVVTLDWDFPRPERKELTDRLGGAGFRHWYVATDLNAATSMYVRYGEAEGDLLHPEPIHVPFTHWSDHLGPLRSYADFLAGVYDTDQADATVGVLAACLAVVELESGVRLDRELQVRRPHAMLPLPGDADLKWPG